MDYISESNTSLSTSNRIAITAVCGFAVAVTGLILIIMLCVKAYRSILQRLFMYLMLTILVNNSCNVASVHYKFRHGDTVIQVLDDRACKYLGFISVWSYWCSYTICTVTVLYLVILVLTRTRNCPACVVEVRNSRRLRVFLEVCTISGVLLGPLLVLWIPFYNTWFTYGLNNTPICGLTAANSENESYSDILLVSLLNGGAIVQLMGLTTLLGTIVMLLNYCTLPPNLQHAAAKKLTKRIVVLFLGIFVYVVVYDIRYIKWQFLSVIVSYLLLVVLSTTLIIYLAAIHFSKLCAPSLKNLLKRKKEEKLQDQHQERTRDYESLKEVQTKDFGSLEDCEPPKTPSTHFSVPYTGEFTTITQV